MNLGANSFSFPHRAVTQKLFGVRPPAANEHQVEANDHQVEANEHQVEANEHQVEANEHQVEANEHQVEANEHQVEANEHQVEANEHQVEANEHQGKMATAVSRERRRRSIPVINLQQMATRLAQGKKPLESNPERKLWNLTEINGDTSYTHDSALTQPAVQKGGSFQRLVGFVELHAKRPHVERNTRVLDPRLEKEKSRTADEELRLVSVQFLSLRRQSWQSENTIVTLSALLASLNSCCNPWIYMIFSGHLLSDFAGGLPCCRRLRTKLAPQDSDSSIRRTTLLSRLHGPRLSEPSFRDVNAQHCPQVPSAS
ncbi:putative arg8-vasotocin receptor-like [Scophthalmus maximus]|uniref:Putative arg8-vasotocin receptor-like n=1 Tax=Scophthalmus maximus TaxID=52904 RepID=A0A2U9B3F7_SCOMX|nr:putative arg8-vasotocin receptor-like [Scophthalmus maximus]